MKSRTEVRSDMSYLIKVNTKYMLFTPQINKFTCHQTTCDPCFKYEKSTSRTPRNKTPVAIPMYNTLQ